MANYGKGIVAGLIGTATMSVLMVIKSMMGLMPKLDVIHMLSNMLHVTPPIAWVMHFMIGAVWGLLFAAIYRSVPGGGPVGKGMVLATGAWLLMMVMIMPMAGAGLFGMNLGIMAPIMTLVLHWVFGAVMGAVYGRPAEARVATT